MRAHATRLLPALGLGISAAVLAAVVVWALQQPAPELPTSGGRLGALAGAIGLYALATALRGERWRILLEENGAQPPRSDSHGLMLVGYMGNTVLPARGGDALRAVLMAPRARTDVRSVVGTLVAERVLDVAVLLTLFAALAYGLLRGVAPDVGGRFGFTLLIAAGVLVVVGLVALVLHRTGHLRRAVGFVAPMLGATRNLLRGMHGVEVLALTVLLWTVEGAVWFTCGLAAGLDLSVIEALYLLALASVFAMIPSGPGYAGTMDAAVLIGARALGYGAAASLGYLLLLRFVLFVPITAAGAIVGAARYGGWARLRTLARR